MIFWSVGKHSTATLYISCQYMIWSNGSSSVTIKASLQNRSSPNISWPLINKRCNLLHTFSIGSFPRLWYCRDLLAPYLENHCPPSQAWPSGLQQCGKQSSVELFPGMILGGVQMFWPFSTAFGTKPTKSIRRSGHMFKNMKQFGRSGVVSKGATEI